MATQQAEIILFDIPSRDPCESWSLNPWKTRMALSYKGLDYKTTWVEYPDIEPTLKSFGIAPNPPGSGTPTPYSLPAVKLGKAYIMDSWSIAEALEEQYPEPSLRLDSPLLGEVRSRLGPVFSALRGVWMPKVSARLLNPRSADYFERTRAAMFRLPLDEYAEQHGGDKAWDNAEAPIRELAELLKRNDGPFILGDKVSYADFYVVSALHFLRTTDENDYIRFVGLDPDLGKLVEACAQWLERRS